MLRRYSRFALSIALLLGLILSTCTAWAAPSASQRKEIAALGGAVQRAGALYGAKKYEESGELLKAIQQRAEKLAAGGDKGVIKQLGPVYISLKRARSLLKKQGISLPPITEPGKKKPVVKKPGDAAPLKLPPTGNVSFVKHMAPILMSKCGRCHVRGARGMVSMANYADLLKGAPNSDIIVKGDPDSSRLVEAIEGGDMPRGSVKVSPEELTTIKMWIKQGAKYDGKDPKTSLASLAPNVKPSQPARLTVTKATGKESVSFSADLAPVLSEKCANCHGRGRMPSGRFNLNTFAAMLRGGESGVPFLPGKPADSMLIKKLKGTGGGQRMPLRQPALSADVIAKFETWIAEGAKFDGPDANQLVEQVATLAKAKASTHEELSADRVIRSESNWRLGFPDIKADRIDTKNFLLLGNIGEQTLQGYADLAESMVPKVAEQLGASSNQPLIKGRQTLYFFSIRYDYSEFGNMVENRQLPREWKGHWRNNIVEAYGTVLPSRNDQYSADALLAQNLAGAHIAGLTTMPPHWFSEGVARAVAAKIAADDSRIAKWDEKLPEVMATLDKKNDFMTGKMSQEDADIASYSFVKFLMTDSSRFDRLLAALKKGTDFEKALVSAYGSDSIKLAGIWAPRALTRK